MIGTAVRLDAQAAEGPQLPLSAEAVRCLQNGHQHRCPDRTHGGNLAKQWPGLVLLAFLQQLAPNFSTQRSQCIELLVIKLCSPAHAWFADLRKPLGTMTGRIYLL